MRAQEFIIEGTELFVGDDYVFAKRLSTKDGPIVQMFITKDEWNQIKDQQANTEMGSYDIATAEMIVNDMVKQGASVKWKSAADFNKDARELENHRFRNHPEVNNGFSASIQQARDNAGQVTRSMMKSIK